MQYQKKCIICNENFLTDKKLSTMCSIECKKQNNRNNNQKSYLKKNNKEKFNGNCLNCKNLIENFQENKRKRYCSKECELKFKYSHKTKVVKNICKICNNEFETKKKKTQICSNKCRNKNNSLLKHEDVTLKCKNCNGDYVEKYVLRESSQFCSRSCAKKYMHKNSDRTEIYNNLSLQMKEKYKNGDLTAPFLGKKISDETKKKIKKTKEEKGYYKSENNPMFGKKHSKETREKMSKIVSEKILEGKRNYKNNRCKTGHYFSNKLNKEIYYRSSWELGYFKNLDNDNTVKIFINEPIYISYYYFSKKRNYIPDLLVEYIDGSRKLIEIKPSCYENAEINKQKFKAAREYCKKENIEFEVWTELRNPYLL